MKKKIVFLLIALSTIVNAQGLSLSDLDISSFPTIKAKFFALDAGNNQILNLSPSDFEVTENGIIRKVTFVSCPSPQPPAPLSSVLTIDVSGSMDYGNMDIAKAAAKAWVNMLPLGTSECAVTSFDNLNYLNIDFSTDKNKLLQAIGSLQPNGGTDYNHALLYQPSGGLVISTRGIQKKVIVFLTDGQPNYPCSDAQIIAEAKKQNCTIYSVVLGMPCPPSLKYIATQTGGLWYENITTEKEAEEIYKQILIIAQSGGLCSIEWLSDIACYTHQQAVEVKLLPNNVSDYCSYNSPSNSVANLEIKPYYLDIKNIIPGKKKDTIITVKAINSDFKIKNVSLSNPLFSINKSSFELAKGNSMDLIISYTPSDSGYEYCKIIFENDLCPKSLYAIGGYLNKKLKPRTLKLTHPNGGEEFIAGSDTIITWEGISPSEKVTLEYRPNDAAQWVKLTDTATGLRYNFHVPYTASDYYLARVTAGLPDQSCESGFVQIGEQIWTCKNLDVDHYRNGDPIPYVPEPGKWGSLTTGAWRYVNNDPALGAIYGKLYNWYAVNDPRGLAPVDWHIPTDAEWTELGNYLGGDNIAGAKLKEAGTAHWNSPNTGATNEFGFSALPGGVLDCWGAVFFWFKENGAWWTANENNSYNAWYRSMSFGNTLLFRNNECKTEGFSVRLVKD